MGCKNSKSTGGEQPIDTTDVQVVEKGTVAPASAPKGKQGYKTEIKNQKQTVAVGATLVQRNMGKLKEVYDVNEAHVLGRGACGSVCVVHKRGHPDEVFAMKTVSLGGNGISFGQSLEELRHEIEIQKKLDHPNIARVFEYFEDPKESQMHIIMELCRGGALVSRMKTHRNGYGERAAATLVYKMLSAILYCHNRGVVHRDIKLDNFIYEDEREDAELKLIDFGFAAEVAPGNEWMWEQIGTPSYMSPELWADYSKAYESSVDMWAIGVCAYMLLSGKRPFHSSNRQEKKRMIQQDPVRFNSPEWERVTKEGKDFCLQLMQKDPKKRLGASQALNHPWIKNMAGARKSGSADGPEDLAQHASICANLEEFARADNMRKVAMEVIAFSTPPAKLNELRDLFVKMDENASGTLSEDEFVKAMAGTYQPEEAKRLFRLIDANDSKEIEYMEFLGAAMSKRTVLTKPSLMSAFSILDRDGNGEITKAELRLILAEDCTDEDIDEMIRQAGGVTGINYEQFKSLMLRDMNSMQRARAWQSAGKLTAMAQLRLSAASGTGSGEFSPQQQQ